VKRNALPYRDNHEVLREHLDDETAALAYLDGPSTPEDSGVACAVDDERGSRCRNLATAGIGGDSRWSIRATRTFDAATNGSAR